MHTKRDVERAFWLRIAEGLTSEDAAIACGVSGPVGSRWFRQGGGMPRIGRGASSGRYLSFAEREEIALLRARDVGIREIARRLGRAPSTISRELRRNAATRNGRLDYRAGIAQWKAERPDGTPAADPVAPAWKGRNKPRRADRRWATAWSPERQRMTGRLHNDQRPSPIRGRGGALRFPGRGARGSSTRPGQLPKVGSLRSDQSRQGIRHRGRADGDALFGVNGPFCLLSPKAASSEIPVRAVRPPG
jgi:transcriptional regulator with XRE-family HTH domain